MSDKEEKTKQQADVEKGTAESKCLVKENDPEEVKSGKRWAQTLKEAKEAKMKKLEMENQKEMVHLMLILKQF